MTRSEIELAVQQIVAAVGRQVGLVQTSNDVTRATRLHDDLDMDDVDIVGVLCTAENRFGIILPDDFDSDASCTVDDIVDLIAKRLIQKEALLAHTANPAISARGESPNLVTETISSQLYRAADVRGDRPPGA
jgi:acyl carrier protein